MIEDIFTFSSVCVISLCKFSIQTSDIAGTKLTRKIDRKIKKSVEQNLFWVICSKMSGTNIVVNTVDSDVHHYVSFTEINYLVLFVC